MLFSMRLVNPFLPPAQHCHCTWFNRCCPGWWDEHPPCQHPKYPKWIFASLCSTAYSEQQGSTWTPQTFTTAGTINPNDFQLQRRNLLKNKTEFFTYPWLYLESRLDSKTQPPAQTGSQIYLKSKRASLQPGDDGASFGSAFQTLTQHPLPITTCHFEMPVPLSS